MKPLKSEWNITPRQAELLVWAAANINQHMRFREKGEAAAAEFRACKARGLFGKLFGTIAKAHLKCPRPQCRRARRCDRWVLDCAKTFAPPSEHEAVEAVASFNSFVCFAQMPHPEEAECGKSSSFSGG